MKRFTKTLMVALMAVCLSVCFLFAGCAKHSGTYVGVTVLTQKSIELKLKANEEFELTVSDSTIEGTWAVDEENENVVNLTFESGSGTGSVEEDTITLAILSSNLTIVGANGAKLTKK